MSPGADYKFSATKKTLVIPELCYSTVLLYTVSLLQRRSDINNTKFNSCRSLLGWMGWVLKYLALQFEPCRDGEEGGLPLEAPTTYIYKINKQYIGLKRKCIHIDQSQLDAPYLKSNTPMGLGTIPQPSEI